MGSDTAIFCISTKINHCYSLKKYIDGNIPYVIVFYSTISDNRLRYVLLYTAVCRAQPATLQYKYL